MFSWNKLHFLAITRQKKHIIASKQTACIHRYVGRCDIILHNSRATLTPEMLDELLIVPTVITPVHSHVVREHNRRQDRERRAEVLDDAVSNPEETRGGDRLVRRNNPGQPAIRHLRSPA